MEPDDIAPPIQPAEPAADEGAVVADAAAPATEVLEPVLDAPEKFKDADGRLRVDALLKSYVELERKVAAMLPQPSDPDDLVAKERLWAALGRPKAPVDYQIAPRAEWLERDPDLDEQLFSAGFSNAQAQLVYDLAAERIEPILDAALREVEAARSSAQERSRLEEHFGGAERWQALSRQIKAFGERHLDPDTFQALSRSFDGVVAVYNMMRSKEPDMVSGGDPGQLAPDAERLTTMMRDPRYWRDRDKDFIARVTDGFRRLYGS